MSANLVLSALAILVIFLAISVSLSMLLLRTNLNRKGQTLADVPGGLVGAIGYYVTRDIATGLVVVAYVLFDGQWKAGGASVWVRLPIYFLVAIFGSFVALLVAKMVSPAFARTAQFLETIARA